MSRIRVIVTRYTLSLNNFFFNISNNKPPRVEL